MSDPKLTAVICFANEGEEVEHTVRGIRETCKEAVDILLINDASDDDHDYEIVADQYGCRYLENEARIGPAHSRHKGLTRAKTEYVIFLDAHMRFYEADWHEAINRAIEQEPNALYCTRSRPLKPGGAPSGAPMGIGASIEMAAPKFEDWLKAEWNVRPRGEGVTSYVPCVLGGCYAAHRDFMLGYGGYRGLHRYGGEEPLISIKSWLSGGSCQVINNVVIGHIYRGGKPAPWKDTIRYFHFNKLATARIIMDDAGFQNTWEMMAALPNAQSVQDVYKSRETFVEKARDDFLRVQQQPFEYFLRLNTSFRRGELITP